MRIYLRGHIFWVEYRLDGGIKRISTGQRTLSAAESWCRDKGLESPVQQPSAPSYTWPGLLGLWQQQHPQKKTLSYDLQRLGTTAQHLPPLDALTADDILRWRDWLVNNKAPQTAKHYLVILKAAINLARIRGWGLKDLFAGFVMPSINNARHRTITPGEYELIYEASSKDMRVALMLAKRCGMRRGEIVGLKWSMVHLTSKAHILLPTTKNGDEGYIPLPGDVAEMLSELRRSGKGRPVMLNRDSVTQAWQRITTRLNIKGAVFHDLRRTFATDLKRRGVSLADAAKLTRHRDIQTLYRHYIVVEREELHLLID